MDKSCFNHGWLFYAQGKGEQAVPVILPHDAMLLEPRDRDSVTGAACGYFPGGSYLYTKRFTASANWREKHIVVEFEGVYKNASVFLNGRELARQAYGYTGFYVTLDEALRFGEENELHVVADNSACPNSRWYSGSGIYRDVSLYTGEKTYILPDGIRIRAEQDGSVRAELNVCGGDTVKLTILDGDRQLNSAEAPVSNGKAVLTMHVAGAETWSAESPRLYRCVAVLMKDGVVADRAEDNFGFRTLSWSTKGFFVNGQETLFRGACIHHDNGILGACSYEAAEERRVRLLKEAGFNALRMAHNPASKALLNACDRLGMYVMDEFCDNWLIHKNPYDYADQEFRADWKKDLQAMLVKNYNHPSVVMTSIGNEISELALPEGQEYCRKMADFCRSYDPSRPVTLGVNFMLCSLTAKGSGIYGEKKNGKENKNGSQGLDKMPTSQFFNFWMNKLGGIIDKMAAKPAADKATTPAFAALDIGGYNYATSRYEMEGSVHPERVIVGSETLPKNLYTNWQLVKKLPYLCGDFMWTGWDYLGESGIGTTRYKSFSQPGNDAPIISGGCGVIDICGKLRPEVQWNRLVWGLTDRPAIAVEPYTHAGEIGSVSMWRDTDAVGSWSWAGCEGKKNKVTVYASGAFAELFVNGRSCGKKKTREFKAVYKKVPYEPGTVTAVSYDEAGREIARSSLTTALGETEIRLYPEKTELLAGGKDLCYINIELAGADGVVRAAEDRRVTVEVCGAGELLALGSAKPNMGEDFISDTHTTYYGKALAVIRTAEEKGAITVTVHADGLDDQSVTVQAI